jgi:fatty-acyl-CoA synthase
MGLISGPLKNAAQRPALWTGTCWLSYAELDGRAARLARQLASKGIKRGDRVAILALNHVAHIDLLLAAEKLGCIFAPINYRLSAAELRALAELLWPAYALVDALCAAQAPLLGCAWQPLEQYEHWLEQAAEGLSPDHQPDPEDIWMLLSTGGSSGVAKSAMLPYRQVLANARSTIAGWALRDDDCAIQSTPCFHAAFNALAVPLLHQGGRVVLMPQFVPGAYLQAAQQHAVTLTLMVPTMYRMLAEHEDFDRADLSRIRCAISGGAACTPALIQRYAARGIRFRQGFGMTEAGVNCFAIDLDEAAVHPQSVGRPMHGVEAVIRRADGSACGVDEVGELTLAGAHLCQGYYQRPQETAAAFRDGWLWTGDLALRDADGRYFIRGRRKEMFISGGENVYPVEIEAALAQCADVAECAVLGVPDARWDEAGLAAVVLNSGSAATAESLRAELRPRLAPYKLPRHFLFLPALPKSAAGKILKPEIRKLHEQGQPDVSHAIA